MTNFYIFGDSIVFGQYVNPHQTWAIRFAEWFTSYPSEQANLVQVLGVNGETSLQALNRFDYCVTAHDVDYLWIQFGLNDSNYWKSDHGQPRVEKGLFKENILRMIRGAHSSGVKKIFLATNHEVIKPLAHDPNSARYALNALEYNNVIRLIAIEFPEDVVLVDIERSLKATGVIPRHYLLEDGVHLNLDGHEFYFQAICEKVKSVIGTK